MPYGGGANHPLILIKTREMIYKDDFTYIAQNVMFNGASTDWNNIIFLLEGLKENIDSEFFPHTSEWVDVLISNAKVAKRKNCSYDNMISSIMAFAFFYHNMANIMGLDE